MKLGCVILYGQHAMLLSEDTTAYKGKGISQDVDTHHNPMVKVDKT